MKIIPYLLVLFFVLLCQSVIAQHLINESSYINISSGTYLNVLGDIRNEGTGTINNGGLYSVSGDITNNASNMMNTGTGDVKLNGTSMQSLAGTNDIIFYNLDIDNSSVGIILNRGISVSNNLNMTDGNIDLNNYTIDLGTTGVLTNETASARIYGSSGVIQATRDLNAPSADDVAGLGLEITSSANMGTTQISRGHEAQSAAGGGILGIERYYDVSPANNTGLDASITFNYYDVETTGHTEANLVSWKSIDGGSTWTNEGGTVNTTANQLTHSGIDGFSRWTLSDQVNNPLPVELLTFTARLTSLNQVQLDWVTATEINSKHFEVLRSQNGEDFEWIGTVDAQGFSEYEIAYEFLDERPYLGQSYYQLRMVDLDGTFEYSEVKPIYISTFSDNITLYPNPVNNQAVLHIKGLPDNKDVIFYLFNTLGQQIMEIPISQLPAYDIKLEDFPAATYFYLIKENTRILKTGQLIIQE